VRLLLAATAQAGEFLVTSFRFRDLATRMTAFDPNGIAFVVLFPFSALYVIAVWLVRKRKELAPQSR
jgi:hypothetical protein